MEKIEYIQFRVTAEEKKQIKKLAEKELVSMSDYIRRKCLIKED